MTGPRMCIVLAFVGVACSDTDPTVTGVAMTVSAGPTAATVDTATPTPTTSETGAPTDTGSAASTDEEIAETGADPSTSSASEPLTSESGTPPDMGGPQCLPATQPCADTPQCCAGLECGTTTLGQVCCGLEGTPCNTPNGEDCCGDLLCTAGACITPGGVPSFKAPFPCGQSWTYSHHDQEVRRALDFIDNGGTTDGAPALAALGGVATQHYEEAGAGNYIVIDHGGGWTTYYFHLQGFSVDDGAFVTQGQQVGVVGSTGASSGPHLHFEELYYGEGKDIWLDGQLLAPYPGQYGQASHVSGNCP